MTPPPEGWAREPPDNLTGLRAEVKEATRCPDTARPTDKTSCYDPLPGAAEARGTVTGKCHKVGRGERVGRGPSPPGRKGPSPPSPPLRGGGIVFGVYSPGVWGIELRCSSVSRACACVSRMAVVVGSQGWGRGPGECACLGSQGVGFGILVAWRIRVYMCTDRPR